MYVATLQSLSYREQESKTRNLQFIFLTHLWAWNKVKVIKCRMIKLTSSKVMIMQSLKDLALIAFNKT